MKLSNSAAQVSTRLKTAVTPSCFARSRTSRPVAPDGARNPLVGEAVALRLAEIRPCVSESSVRPSSVFFELHDLAELLEEPRIDRGHLLDLLHRVAALECEPDVAQALRIRRDQPLAE